MDNGFHTFRGYQLLNHEQQDLTPSMEDYLEMIYRNCEQEGHVRMNQLAGQLNVRVSSATKIVQKLAKLGFLHYQPYGIIELTEKGKQTGQFLLHRHQTLERFLRMLGLGGTLLQDTEMIEHQASPALLTQIDLFLRFLEQNPAVATAWQQFCRPAADC
ncbi:MAG: iron dependent repressor, metal binding and dimerization domain protein [Sporomusaceae bacterium]|nr:iron dependent repressor, metal binding and dimerization domain protein [Sporomusaceae bacterium]